MGETLGNQQVLSNDQAKQLAALYASIHNVTGGNGQVFNQLFNGEIMRGLSLLEQDRAAEPQLNDVEQRMGRDGMHIRPVVAEAEPEVPPTVASPQRAPETTTRNTGTSFHELSPREAIALPLSAVIPVFHRGQHLPGVHLNITAQTLNHLAIEPTSVDIPSITVDKGLLVTDVERMSKIDFEEVLREKARHLLLSQLIKQGVNDASKQEKLIEQYLEEKIEKLRLELNDINFTLVSPPTIPSQEGGLPVDHRVLPSGLGKEVPFANIYLHRRLEEDGHTVSDRYLSPKPPENIDISLMGRLAIYGGDTAIIYNTGFPIQSRPEYGDITHTHPKLIIEANAGPLELTPDLQRVIERLKHAGQQRSAKSKQGSVNEPAVSRRSRKTRHSQPVTSEDSNSMTPPDPATRVHSAIPESLRALLEDIDYGDTPISPGEEQVMSRRQRHLQNSLGNK